MRNKISEMLIILSKLNIPLKNDVKNFFMGT